MTMLPFVVFGIAFPLLVSRVYPGICGVKSGPIKSFLKLMLWVTAARLLGFYFGGFPKHLDNDVITHITPLITLCVFWEDAFFTLPILALERYGVSKKIKYVLLALSSIVFASGHLVYGLPWAIATLFYVPLISYRLGKRYGLGTVMICHILYDLITVLTLRLAG